MPADAAYVARDAAQRDDDQRCSGHPGTALRYDRRLPLRLAKLHWATKVGDVIELPIQGRPQAGPSVDDLVVGAGFVFRDGHRAERRVSLPDTVGAGMRFLVCGLNPSVYAAERGVGFARGTNRFWPAVVAAGLVDRERDPLHALVSHGVGMTDLVKRATLASSELGRDEYAEGAARVERLARWLRPKVVAFVGLEGWRAAIDRSAAAGLQPSPFAGRPAYVLPSTSGLNAHVRLADLVEHFRCVAAVADSA